VVEGIYKATDETGTPNDRTKAFSLETGDSLLGGFRGIEAKAGELRDGRDTSWMYHQSILSGDIGTVGDSTDNTQNLVTIGFGVKDNFIHG